MVEDSEAIMSEEVAGGLKDEWDPDRGRDRINGGGRRELIFPEGYPRWRVVSP